MKTLISRNTLQNMLLIMVMILSSITVLAQNKPENVQPEKKGNDRHDKIEAQKIAFITQQIELTVDEAKAFWPVYYEYEAKRKELRKNYYSREDLKKDDFAKMSEKEASQILDKQLTEAQKAMDLRKEYVAKYRAILPAVKVLQLQHAEREFQKLIIDKLRENKEHSPQPKK